MRTLGRAKFVANQAPSATNPVAVGKALLPQIPSEAGGPCHLPCRPAGAIIVLVLGVLLTSCGFSRTRLTPQPTTSTDWPTVGGDLRNRSVAHGSALRIDTLLWQRKTGGVASTEPTVSGGYLYFSGRDRRLEVYDAQTGHRRYRGRYNGPVTGVVPGDSLFAFATDQDERRLFLCQYRPVRVVEKIDIPTSSAPPRRLHDGSILIAGLHGDIIRFDTDGSMIWQISARGPVSAAPTVGDSLLLVSAGRKVIAYHLSDATEAWSYSVVGAVRAAPALDDYAYIASTDSILYAVSAVNGSMEWFFATSGQLVASPAVGPTRVFLSSNDGNVYGIDKANGRELWRYYTGAPANTSPVLAGNTLVVSTQKAKLLLLDAATGALLKQFDLEAPAATAPVVAGGHIYVTDFRRQLYCFGPATPTPVATD
jgi:outer membrane protein assembly factor BamB